VASPSPFTSTASTPRTFPTSTPVSSPSSNPLPLAAFPDCRLPYIKPPSAAHSFTGGFVSGQPATWTQDSLSTLSGSANNLLITDAKPTLTGSALSSWDTGSYDAAIKRWLPVRRSQVRDDGLAYAYAEPFASAGGAQYDSTRVHVVSLPGGGDRVVYTGSPRVVVAYEPDGVYISSVRYFAGEGFGSGLWRIDPSTGASTEIPNGMGFQSIEGRFAWTAGGGIQPKVLTRLDVTAGTAQTWFDTNGTAWIWFLGLDSNGHPIIDVSPFDNNWKLEVISSPQVGTPIADISLTQVGVTDKHGTWLAGSDGIYLLRPDSSLVRVSDVTGGDVAGGCE
jgi:hypothetical protein